MIQPFGIRHGSVRAEALSLIDKRQHTTDQLKNEANKHEYEPTERYVSIGHARTEQLQSMPS
jgi:hypothetical protein